MKIRIPIAGLLFALLLAGFGCNNALNPTEDKPELSYALHIPVCHPDSLSIAITVSQNGAYHSFALPYVYADNPVDSFIGPLYRELSAFDASGDSIGIAFSEERIGPRQTRVMHIPEQTKYPITISYVLQPNAVYSDNAARAMPLTYVNNHTGFLLGSHVFAIPYETDLVALWRNQRDIELSILTGDTIDVAGLPEPTVRLRNAYELLFVQVGIEPNLKVSGQAAGQPYALYAGLWDMYPDASRMRDAAAVFESTLKPIVPRYGTLSAQPYPVFFGPIVGGLEGTYSFVCKNPEKDTDSVLAMIFAHETLHHWIGIRASDREDPWFKEGVTSYLGLAIPARLGWLSDTYLKNTLFKDVSFPDSLFVAPSAPSLRSDLFVKGLNRIAYVLGAQIAMLIDLRVRVSTGNRAGLNSLTATLTHAYNGGAFSREQMIAHFSHEGADIRDIFETYADNAAAIPDSITAQAFQKLDSLGAFGD
jgi:hypothetical protein